MADPHGSHGSPGASSHHALEEPPEDALRTPTWLPLFGFGLLMAAALGVYLFVSPGILSTPTGDAGAGDAAAAADASAP